MKQLILLVVLIGSFWVGQAWADMDRVSNPVLQTLSNKHIIQTSR